MPQSDCEDFLDVTPNDDDNDCSLLQPTETCRKKNKKKRKLTRPTRLTVDQNTTNIDVYKNNEAISEDNLLRANAQDLLTDKERIIETFFHDLLSLQSRDSNGDGVDVMDEADEQALLAEAEDKLADASILLSHKYSGLLKALLSRKHQADFETAYSKIPTILTSGLNLGVVYNQCFNTWIDSPHINFATGNKMLLGNLSGKDCFILHLFAFATCKRAKCDDCYALSITGKSSVGKSRLIEDVLQQSSFTYNCDKGVGRFSVKNRPILLYRDVDLEVLIKGPDATKFRTICRSETTSVKIHSSTVVLPALWVLITSNQRVNNHTFEIEVVVPAPQREHPIASTSNNTKLARHSFFQSHWNKQLTHNKQSSPGDTTTQFVVTTKREVFHSQLELPGTKRERLDESLRAVRNRVLEAFIKERPDISSAPLPSGAIFQRGHFIVGVFERIVQIMKLYNVQDFHSPMLVSYILTALCDNFSFYKRTWPEGLEDGQNSKVTKTDITLMVAKYVTQEDLQIVYMQKLDQP